MRDILNLFKLRIGVAIALAAAAGLVVEQGTRTSLLEKSVLVLAVLVASASAGAFNQYVERDLDARMGRTKRTSKHSTSIRHLVLEKNSTAGMRGHLTNPK